MRDLPLFTELQIISGCRDMTRQSWVLRAHFWLFVLKNPEKCHFQISLRGVFRANGDPLFALNEFQGRYYKYLGTYRAGF